MKLTGRRLGKAAFVILALVIGKELGSALPDDSAALRPFEVTGAVGQVVALRTASVQVDDVQLAPTLMTSTAGYRTPGLWLVVTVTLTPVAEHASFALTAIRSADGVRTWEGRSRESLVCQRTPPGVPVVCDLAFEVPPEALPGADLLLATAPDQRHDTVAVIELGLSQEQVDDALETEDPIEARDPAVGGPRG